MGRHTMHFELEKITKELGFQVERKYGVSGVLAEIVLRKIFKNQSEASYYLHKIKRGEKV